MILRIYTIIHVVISLLGIASGFVVIYGLLNADPLEGWTKFFLWTTVLTSVTGFFFPFRGFTPAFAFGIISLVVLAAAIYARYPGELAGHWRWIYVVGVVLAQYLNFFVLIVQSFQKIPALKKNRSDAERPVVQNHTACGFGRVRCAWRLRDGQIPRRTRFTHFEGKRMIEIRDLYQTNKNARKENR